MRNIWSNSGAAPDHLETARLAALMPQHGTHPIDLGDASLGAATETMGLRTVFTFDQQFCVYG